MELQVERNLTGNVEVFAGVENINDTRYFVANAPVGTGSLCNIGLPTLYRIGLGSNFPAERK
jgi:hypothetical protein